MQIDELEYTTDGGEKMLRISFTSHKRVMHNVEIKLTHERCAALRIAKAKEAAIDEFLTTFDGRKFTKKEILKAYAKKDEHLKNVYKELYPHGGKRTGGGRPKGTTTEKTESFDRRITKREKQFLIDCLDCYRNKPETPFVSEWLKFARANQKGISTKDQRTDGFYIPEN